MELSDFIVGLMRCNYEAVGFIPQSTIANRYIRRQDYILQCAETGKAVGYLLHGPIGQGRATHVVQHCIEIDQRNRGYGQQAVYELVRRCVTGGASSICLRCATDLPSVDFWKSCGFTVRSIVNGGTARNRQIAEMYMLLDVPLLK